MAALKSAPEWAVSDWLNASQPLSLGVLKGRAVFVVAFQMLCPGCVSHGLPQAQRVRAAFSEKDLAVIGLHTVFEHVDAQGSTAALAAFLSEYRIGFPVGIDAPTDDSAIPQTMRAYNMQGTPTTILIDRDGRLRLQRFGHVDDLSLGAAIATLIGEAPAPPGEIGRAGCGDDGCRL